MSIVSESAEVGETLQDIWSDDLPDSTIARLNILWHLIDYQKYGSLMKKG